MIRRCMILAGVWTLSLSLLQAGEGDKEKQELSASCSSLFSSFAAIGSCAGFLGLPTPP